MALLENDLEQDEREITTGLEFVGAVVSRCGGSDARFPGESLTIEQPDGTTFRVSVTLMLNR